jgi:hypothetical protein
MERFKVSERAIDRVLDIFGETLAEPAVRASNSLSALLLPVQESLWPEVRYSFSRLTGDGFPVEFTFSSATNGISYTTELAGPEIAEAKKIEMAAGLLLEKNNELSNDSCSVIITRLAQQQALTYGAWMAGRHEDGKNDRYKSYLEVTGSCAELGLTFLQRFLPDFSVIDSQCFSLRMLSVGRSNKIEYYFRLSGIDVWQLLFLMRSIGFSEQGKELLDFVSLVSKRKVDKSFIGDSLGFSVALDEAGMPEAITIFTFNHKVFEPGDGSIRDSVLRFSDWFGWDFNSYERITEHLAGRTSRLTSHGLVAFTVTLDGKKIFQIGLRPPKLW